MAFRDRSDAGQQLAGKLERLRGRDVVVLGLPRGGVPVAFEVASTLKSPLDVIVVRKLGVPFQPELGMGAIGEDAVRIVNHEVVRLANVSEGELAQIESRERIELERQAQGFRGGRQRVPLQGRTAIIVDDGIATGSTARAACQVARAHGAETVVLAVPVAPWPSIVELSRTADEVVCLSTPQPFYAVGEWYHDFSQTSDEEVVNLLERAAKELADAGEPIAAGRSPERREEDVEIPAGTLSLAGNLVVPELVRGFVLFAHGSGSSRHSPRNRFVATALNHAGLGTLLLDLLTPEEEVDRSQVFDIELLASRLVSATNWLRELPDARARRLGYFGASTGAAAALRAAAELQDDVAAVVSRGGRPDLAGDALEQVTAPTLFIVGGNDEVVLDLNRQARVHLRCESEVAVIPGATHLFEESGALEKVADLAQAWFIRHLAS